MMIYGLYGFVFYRCCPFFVLLKKNNMKMKLPLLVLISSLGYLFFASSSRSENYSLSMSGSDTVSAAMPDSVRLMVEKSCMNCHSNDGSALARGKLNFSKWDTYSLEKQFNKASKCCNELVKGDMPPKKWRAKNPDRIPSQAQIEALCRWSKTLPVK
jgi:hypothetical protein